MRDGQTEDVDEMVRDSCEASFDGCGCGDVVMLLLVLHHDSLYMGFEPSTTRFLWPDGRKYDGQWRRLARFVLA